MKNQKLKVLVAPGAYVINDNRTESLGTMTYYILRELGKLGVETTALTMKAEITNPIPNCRIIELLPGQEITQLGLLRFMTKYYQAGKKLLRNEDFDVFHHMFPFGWEVGFNPLVLRGHTKSLPFVVGPLLAPHTTKVNLSDEKNITKSYGNKAKSINLKERLSSGVFNSVVSFGKEKAFSMFQETLNRADWVISGDLHTQRSFAKYVDAKKHSVFRIGIDLEQYKPEEVRRKKKEESSVGVEYIQPRVEILTVGYLVERKGIKYLIEGFANIAKKYPESYIKVVGDGPARSDLEKLAQGLGIGDRVEFLGSLKYDEVIPHYHSCDIFCLPALSETWVVAQEAMACGKPVILTDTGSHPEHVPDGKVGYLVPLQDSQAVANALEKMLANPQKRQEMGLAARRHIEENYDWSKIAQQYLELYLKLLN